MIDFKNPDYTEVFYNRQLRLDQVLSDPQLLAIMKVHYRHNPIDFINDWGMTFDPRQVEKGMLATFPFILWPRQEEYINWLMERWKTGEYGLAEKSRDCGVTWLCVAFQCVQWLFTPDFAGGFGSAKVTKVDKKGDPDCIFEKIRFFIQHVPKVFMPKGYNERLHSGFMKLINPENGATITGEGGDDVGRGGRKSLYMVDEAASIERQLAVANSLSATTNCQIDVSTYKGNGNLFYRNAMKFHGTPQKFIFDWKQDPRKDEAWYAKQVKDKDPITVAQEIDRDPNASSTDAFIPAKWVNAAIDLHKLIKLEPIGIRATSFDPADVGDAKAVTSRHGYVITDAEQKTDGDITQAIPWAYELSFKHRSDVLTYDADGMGAPAMKLTFDAYAAGRMNVLPYYGSGKVVDKKKRYGEIPGEPDRTLKTNEDLFLNYRAQTATWARDRFEGAYKLRKLVESGAVALEVDSDKIISIDSTCVNAFELIAELSRPKRKYTDNGIIRVESKKEMKARDIESPNLFDTTIMLMAVKVPSLRRRRKAQTRSIRARDRGVGM
jgi:hypothetical protein